MWIVYSESFKNGQPDRWYYGRYEDRDHANRVAIDLNEMSSDSSTFFCVCNEDDPIMNTVNNYVR